VELPGIVVRVIVTLEFEGWVLNVVETLPPDGRVPSGEVVKLDKISDSDGWELESSVGDVLSDKKGDEF
jgi:hypothetical protein